jgi:redox-sensitive bicupin YhaK (pirin superfamily)
MITLRKSEERGHFKNDWLDSYHTFSFGSYYDSEHVQFGALRVINQDVVAASSGFPMHGHKDMEIFTYILRGTLEHEDSMGNKKQIRAGEVQIMSAGTGVRHSEYNPDNKHSVELLQIWVMPNQLGITPCYDQKIFDKSVKLNQWRLIISPDQENESLLINQKTWVWSSLIENSKTIAFNLKKGKRAWLHVGLGEVSANGKKLIKGDALSFSSEQSLEIQGLAHESDLVLIELD